jgi:hypothetical protein
MLKDGIAAQPLKAEPRSDFIPSGMFMGEASFAQFIKA